MSARRRHRCIRAGKICIRSILRDTSCSSIMHQIFLKQESTRAHRHLPYFPPLHLVHHHNSVVKTSYSLSTSPATTSLRLNGEHSWVHVVFPPTNFEDNPPLYLYRALRRESGKSRGPFKDTALSPIPRIEFESKTPHLGGRIRVVAAGES